MKGYSKASAHRGRVAYRTPSRWLAGKPEAFKQRPNTKLNKDFIHSKVRTNFDIRSGSF